MARASADRTLFFFEKPSAMRQLQRFFKAPTTICVSAEGHLLAAQEPAAIRPAWKAWRFDDLPIALDEIPVAYARNRSGASHAGRIEAIRGALQGVDRVIIATDPGREGSMIAWEVLEHLGYRGRVERLRLGALDEVSIRRAFAALAREPDSGERDYAAYLEALCRRYEDWHLGLNGTRAVSLRLRPPAFREPWRFGGVQTPTLAILADLERRIRDFVPRDFFKVAMPVETETGAALTLWHAPKERIFDRAEADAIREAAAGWSGPLSVVQKDVRRPPPRLFSKDTLARRCAKRFGWDPQRTAATAQDLYDSGFLSYPRTESEHLPESQSGDAAAILAAIAGCLDDVAELVPAGEAIVVRRGPRGHYVKDPGEHHAIVPLRKVPRRGELGPEAWRLWELVAKSYLAAHLPDGIDARTTVAAEVATPPGPKRFAVTGSVVRAPGWRAVYGSEAEDEDPVPGKARRDDEPTTGRLPPLRDGAAARATDATVETAVTEPPRRITRGELPVVMGRLIDQVEDPVLRRALENPANPNEPRGLGTAATRDAVLPKLEKSHYVVLAKGKDPAITVTEAGLAFIDAVRRVFPAYGDPVGRAVFEADLAEIGRAPSRAEAVRRAEEFRQRTRARLDALIAAVAGSERLAVAAPSPDGAGRPPTPAMVAFATALAARKGLRLPRGLKQDAAICRRFLDAHAEQREAAAPGAPRPPTPAMRRYAEALARENGLDKLPDDAATDFSACRRFLDAHAAPRPDAPAKPSPRKPAPRRRTRPPAGADRHADTSN
ncbi:type IA DNA topoisomerase [Methylobacterium nodulans]|uniref:DNA topoisomerase n=1 Tax=Methylobacterium nodulans (strain LMG 21967 / CNCM I-2342 / ORS 2060) TaxID=460265 RepID=B8IEL1_METNO|nr:DNA topoisomerase [Methylobacterium nodulans]ACL59583.1 DNA topoisomerase type IA central domain protein [Methylobacterium nodulans ORS 2060]